MEFMHNERLRGATNPIIIAHGDYLHDFPILFANCMKYNFNDLGILKYCLFIDRVHILKDDGYQKPGLDTLCQELHIKRNIHSFIHSFGIGRCLYTMAYAYILWTYGVVVSMFDFHRRDWGTNPGRGDKLSCLRLHYSPAPLASV